MSEYLLNKNREMTQMIIEVKFENDDLRARLKSAEKERDELKCCGNCEQFVIFYQKPDCKMFGVLPNMKPCEHWTPRKAQS